ncbi:MAG: hypothetical protein L0099_15090, partial [Acidobacteria bacterium]|nr:hypothetical protein [Acidobacteriota bacterium]
MGFHEPKSLADKNAPLPGPLRLGAATQRRGIGIAGGELLERIETGGQHVMVPMLDASLYFFWPDGMMKHTWIGESEFPGPVLYEL